MQSRFNLQKGLKMTFKRFGKTIEQDVCIEIMIQKGSTLKEVCQTMQTKQEEIFYESQQQALDCAIKQLKAACSAEVITNKI